MKVDSYIESLLRKWGNEWFSEDLRYPHRCAYLKDYRPKGYKELENDIDRPEVERLAEWMPINLTPMKIHVLRVRYRRRIRNKREAAKALQMSERRYREYFESAIHKIQNNF